MHICRDSIHYYHNILGVPSNEQNNNNNNNNRFFSLNGPISYQLQIGGGDGILAIGLLRDKEPKLKHIRHEHAVSVVLPCA